MRLTRKNVSADLLVIGAGPAGLAMAVTAARHGLRQRLAFEQRADHADGETVTRAELDSIAALLGAQSEEAETASTRGAARKAPIEFLRPNPRNPRRRFDEAELDELAASIREMRKAMDAGRAAAPAASKVSRDHCA